MMYKPHFALKHYPFDTTLQPDELFESDSTRQAAHRIKHLLELRGIGLLCGEAGSGENHPVPAGGIRVALQSLPGLLRHVVDRQCHGQLQHHCRRLWPGTFCQPVGGPIRPSGRRCRTWSPSQGSTRC